MQVRARSNRKNRTKLDPALPATGADAVAVCTIATAKARLTFNCQVQLMETPTGITCQGNAPIGATQVSPFVIDLTYNAAVVATNVLIIPANASGIRTASGGYAAPQTHTF